MKRFAIVCLVAMATVLASAQAPAQTSIGQAVSPNAVDATKYPGVDTCAQIANAGANNNINVDARGFTGTKTCAGSMFGTGTGNHYMLGNVVIETAVTQAVPSYNTLSGDPSQHGLASPTIIEPWNGHFATVTIPVNATGCSGYVLNFASTSTLTSLGAGGIGYAISDTTTPSKVPANSRVAIAVGGAGTVTSTQPVTCSNGDNIVFTAPVISLGAAVGDNYDARVEDITATCVDNTGAIPTGCIAFQNVQAEQGSWFLRTYAGISQTAYDVTTLGGSSVSPSGPQNSGPYISLRTQNPASPLTAPQLVLYTCLNIAGSPNGANSGLPFSMTFFSVDCGGVSTTTYPIQIDAQNVSLYAVNVGGGINGILIGSRQFSHGISVHRVICEVNVTGNCVTLSSTQGSDSVVIENIQSQSATDIILDQQVNGCTIITGTATTGLGGSVFTNANYIRGDQVNVWSPGGGCPGQTNFTNSTVASPASPNSTSLFTMQGLAGTITPRKTGVIELIMSGTIIATTANINDGIIIQLSYGTGTAPTTNASLVGTQVGVQQEYTHPIAGLTTGDVHFPFSLSWVGSVTGTCTLYAACWLDLAAKAVTGISTVGLSNVNITAIER